jgi:F420-0:gamma-glutamyl ligase
MIVTPLRVEKVRSGSISLHSLVDGVLDRISEGTILVVTSKVAALCESRTADVITTDREALIVRESDYYLSPELSDYGHHFTIAHNTLVGSAGIDESNGDGNYVLWPTDPQETANELCAYIREKHDLQKFGVIITDSTSQPLRLGTTGVAIVAMGEGSEQTPLCVLSDMSFVTFLQQDSSEADLADKVSLEEDLFAPFLKHVPWQKGERS